MIAAAAAKCRYCGEVFDSRVSGSGRRKRGRADEYAGFWLRFVASFVDGLVCGVVMIVVLMVVGGVIVAINGPPGGGNEPGPAEIILGFLIWAIAIVFPWLYSAFEESSPAQATLGKKMLGLRVTDLDGDRISFGQASGRHFGKILSNFFCSIGFIMAGFTEKKQALHDMLAGTLVVKD
ncbi:MAG: RDD family protein [Planctomycetaceae bacterium]|nr:RDD family protein [Planctomycetaceae bacterium]